ncbi:MAG: DMSO/TMAO reductase YedYZ heme-binding membrane subunit [Gammaproteobacteria bacterium]|jgi:DMSO/TMAO reductase YedYZ heme-binding membrane subunit
MAFTSSDRAQRLLVRRWPQLHRIGANLVFAVFVASYVPRAAEDIIYIPFVIMIAFAAGLSVRRFLAKQGLDNYQISHSIS